MKVGGKISTALLNIVLCGLVWNVAAANELPANVNSALKRAGIPAKAVGVVVQDVTSSKPWLEQNPSVLFSPASTMKLLTTDAALELLGPTFTWKTNAYVTGATTGDVLNGDLVIKGSGDPKLVTENFWLFLRQIRATGIREIRGNLVLDRSAFEKIQTDAANFDGDPVKPYNAVPDALLLNYQILRFHFSPPSATTAQANVSVDPPIADYDFNTPQWTNDACGDWQSKLAVNFGDANLRFNGHFPVSCGEKVWYLRPYNMTPNQYFSAVFRKMWTDLGGKFSGDVVDGPVPANARLLTVWESAHLSEVIRDINKFSNNVMARQLLLTLASTESSAPANAERGAEVVKTWLQHKGIDASTLVIENGSGLSRNERIAPSGMADVLAAAYKSSLMPEFVSSLPLVGYDGTMRHRLTTQDVAGNAHIKTGTLNDVKAVAGYVLAASGKCYAVVFLVNHPNAVSSGEAQDALLNWIYTHG